MAIITNNDVSFYQLILHVIHPIFKAGDPTKLLFSIYDNTDKKHITEEYCLHLDKNHAPFNGSLEKEDHKFHFVWFKNLSHELLKHQLYIICHIYRIGSMEAPDVLHHRRHGHGTQQHNFVRPYGACVIKLKDYLSDVWFSKAVFGYIRELQQILYNEHKTNLFRNIPPEIIYIISGYCNALQLGKETFFEPGEAPIYSAKTDHRDFITLPFDIISNSKHKYITAPLSIGIAYGLSLYHGDVSVVKSNHAFYDKLTEIETLYIDPLLNVDRHILYVT
eukprot:167716_1